MKSVSSTRSNEILQAATDAFLELGYGATSVDKIIERVGGSKATVYRYFGNKEQLFVAVVVGILGEIEAPIPLAATEFHGIEQILQSAAEEHLSVVFSERHTKLMRLVAAEAERFPKLGASYYANGPKLGHDNVAEFLRREAAAGTIECADPVTAADDFWGMVLHHGTLRRLYGVARPPSKRAIKQFSTASVERFLRLYPLTSTP